MAPEANSHTEHHDPPEERAAHHGDDSPGHIRVLILTPEGKLFDGSCLSVSGSAGGGAFQLQPDHAPLMAPLDIDILTVELDSGPETFAVHGGFLDVRPVGDGPTEVTVLADVAELGGRIDLVRAQTAADRAKERIESRGTEHLDKDRAEQALKRALLRMRLGGK